MNRPAARLASCTALVALLAQPAAAQDSQPESEPLPADVRDVLANVRDFGFDYDQPGFYALWAAVATGRATTDGPATPVERWTDFLERPAALRGTRVEIRGVIAASRNWRVPRPPYDALGPVWELHLTRRSQPLVAKALLTRDASDLPLGATVVLRGYFLLAQQYYAESGRLMQAAVIVGQAPIAVESPVAVPHAAPSSGLGWLGASAAAIVGGLLAWMLLRRATARPAHDLRELRAAHPPPVNLSAEFSRWSAEHPDDGPEAGRR